MEPQEQGQPSPEVQVEETARQDRIFLGCPFILGLLLEACPVACLFASPMSWGVEGRGGSIQKLLSGVQCGIPLEGGCKELWPLLAGA